MKVQIRHTDNLPGLKTEAGNKYGFGDEMMADYEDSVLFRNISELMKGLIDLGEVRKDPGLSDAREIVKNMMADYNHNFTRNKESERFVREGLCTAESESESESNPGSFLNDEIKSIKQERDKNNLNEVTEEWVKEWNYRKLKAGVADPKTEEITSFVTGAMASSENKHEKEDHDYNLKKPVNRSFRRHVSLAAAAIIAALMLFKVLLPSPNPLILFDSFYKPFEAVSPVTRNIDNIGRTDYSTAIVLYKAGNYPPALAGFDEALKADPEAVTPKFFAGLSHLALGKYEEAVKDLSVIADKPGEYTKEAKWYLGLTYLKTGRVSEATACFEYLSKSGGFYGNVSEKILRRLK